MEIAEGGFSAMVSRELEIGETITAQFPLGNLKHNFSVDAIVRNKNLFRYGFEFVGLCDEMRQMVAQVCESLPLYEGGWH